MFLFVQYIYYFRSKKYSDIRMGLKPFSIYLAKILINIWAKVSFLLNHFWREKRMRWSAFEKFMASFENSIPFLFSQRFYSPRFFFPRFHREKVFKIIESHKLCKKAFFRKRSFWPFCTKSFWTLCNRSIPPNGTHLFLTVAQVETI